MANKSGRKTTLFVCALSVIVLLLGILLNILSTNNSASKVTGTFDADLDYKKIDWGRYEYFDVKLSDTFVITKPGVYHLQGFLDDGIISIDAGDGDVKLIFDNIRIVNSNGPAIYAKSAGNFVIELVGSNFLSDGNSYDLSFDERIDGTIYSMDDLAFIGRGALNIVSQRHNGIVSKDDLVFESGYYQINAANDAVHGKDSILIDSGEFVINADGDAFRSNNADTNKKGFINIKDGAFRISARQKGLNAVNSIYIENGKFEFDTGDDAIHSNNYVGILDGAFVISSSDDGIHADAELLIENGKFDITKSYEGLEAQAVTVNGGLFNIKAVDDGINAAGGADRSALGYANTDSFSDKITPKIILNGGEFYINSSNDGLDSNGTIALNGAKLVIDGPATAGHGALDYNSSIRFNSGSVIAMNVVGEERDLGKDSPMFNLSIYTDSMLPAATKFSILDTEGREVLTHSSIKPFSHIVAGTTDFKKNVNYSLYLDDEKVCDFSFETTQLILDLRG